VPPRRTCLAALAAIPIALALAPPAGAITYCVNDTRCTAAGGAPQSTIPLAFTAAKNHPGLDRVEIGAGTYDAGASGFAYDAAETSNSVEVVGAGMTQTHIVPPAGGGSSYTTLKIASSPLSSVGDLEVVGRPINGISAFNTALSVAGTARRVSVSVQLHVTGVDLSGGSALVDSEVTSTSFDSTSAGVYARGPGGLVERSTVVAPDLAIEAGSGASVLVTHSRISGGATVRAFGGSAVVENSILTYKPGASFFTGIAATANGVATARHVTIDGTGSPAGASRGAEAFSSGAAVDSEIFIESSALMGVETSLERINSSNGTTNITARYSNYDPATNKASGGGSGAISQGPGNVNVNPGYIDRAAGDYNLLADSQMIDAADPNGTLTEDFRLAPRPADGNGDGTATRDIGAFEFVSAPPQAVITGPDTADAGTPATFSGSSSTDPDPGDALTYSWTAAGGGLAKLLRAAAVSATGPDLTQAFPTPGPASVVLTVTDRAGLTASATKAVTVLDKTPPVVSKLKSKNKAFALGAKPTPLTVAALKRGTAFTFTLSEPATVAIDIQSRRAGRVVNGKCKAGAKTGKRCSIYKRKGTLTRGGKLGKNSVAFSGRLASKALAPGAYRAVVTAKDAAGNVSAKRTAAFTVLPG
jgi:hypothetical protein